jgi:hypothetical protein
MLQRFVYYVLIFATAPCLFLAVPVALFEVLALDTGGEWGQKLAVPFLWACDRQP